MRVARQSVEIACGEKVLTGDLSVPADARGLIIFVHGSGSSRLSPRNRMVADLLEIRGFATLLFDLLTEREASDRENVFDIRLLASRTLDATRWCQAEASLAGLRIGYFGASTGAAAALTASAEAGPEIAAVVSRGGRPDLAGDILSAVIAPTLLIVGSRDAEVLELNRWAQRRMRAECSLTIIDSATHLFEEPGTLEQAAEVAGEWFERWISPTGSSEAEPAGDGMSR